MAAATTTAGPRCIGACTAAGNAAAAIPVDVGPREGIARIAGTIAAAAAAGGGRAPLADAGPRRGRDRITGTIAAEAAAAAAAAKAALMPQLRFQLFVLMLEPRHQSLQLGHPRVLLLERRHLSLQLGNALAAILQLFDDVSKQAHIRHGLHALIIFMDKVGEYLLKLLSDHTRAFLSRLLPLPLPSFKAVYQPYRSRSDVVLGPLVRGSNKVRCCDYAVVGEVPAW